MSGDTCSPCNRASFRWYRTFSVTRKYSRPNARIVASFQEIYVVGINSSMARAGGSSSGRRRFVFDAGSQPWAGVKPTPGARKCPPMNSGTWKSPLSGQHEAHLWTSAGGGRGRPAPEEGRRAPARAARAGRDTPARARFNDGLQLHLAAQLHDAVMGQSQCGMSGYLSSTVRQCPSMSIAAAGLLAAATNQPKTLAKGWPQTVR